jgi:CRP/FNR family cyclic AMP-dependent transcriptional regulator
MRVSFFVNRFRELGFFDYGEGGLQVHSSLLNVVLHDQLFALPFLCRIDL